MKKVRDSIYHKINPRLTQARKTKNKKNVIDMEESKINTASYSSDI